ncbi:MAG: SusC/RagA family TonB-linked outer membrane protein [Bacteroidota bacterium]
MRFTTTLIIALLFSFNLIAQNVIRGKVTDPSGEGMIGVNIQIKGTTEGTVTDFDGNFSLTVEPGQTLQISMVGMETQEIVVSDPPVPINIQMKEDAEELDAVVVTGFQEVDRKLFTGSSVSLGMDDIKLNGLTDVSRALEGQVAGVTVDNVSGTFGTSPKIRIRGNTSINGTNQPLFVVDGVILEDMANVNTENLISGDANTLVSSSVANLNPNDIESFQILKDASATAIYGARAANGVIVITTKRGKSGALRVNYSANFSGKIRPTYNQFYIMNSAQEMSVYRELYEKGLLDITTSVKAQNYGAMGKMFTLIANHELEWGPNGTLNEDFLNKYENTNTDWFDVLFNDVGLQQTHSLSFTSGTEKSNNYFSVSYLNDQGQTIADNVQRITGTARNTYFISDSFSFGLKLTGSLRNQKVPGTRNRELNPLTGQYSRSFDINPFSYALNTSRSMRVYDDEGNLEFFRRNYADFNILNELKYNFMEIQVADVSAQTDFEINPIKDLSIKGVFQARYANTKRDHTVHEKSNQAEAYRANGTQFIQDANNLLFKDPNNPGLNPVVVLPQGGFQYLDQTTLLNFFSRISAEWNKNIGDIHEINVLAGQEIRYTNRSNTSTTGLGVVYGSGEIVVTDPNIIEFFNIQDISYYELGNERDRFIGSFINGAYSFKSKYVVNFTARYDGSNQLGRARDVRFLPTWNVSGAWNVSQEPFMQFDWLNNLKLRSTYGISGNLPPNTSALLNLQADVTVRPTDVEPFLYIQDLTNNELTWEKLKEFNVGMDVSLFDGKINTSMDYYKRKSFDLIGAVQTSGVGGQGLKIGNFADMAADGFEVSISTTNIDKNKFTWRTSYNIGYTYDRITRLDFGPRLVDAINANGAAVLGGPRRGLFSTQFAGLSEEGIPQFYNGSGEISIADLDLQDRDELATKLKYEGSTEPRGGGGLTNTFSFGNLTLNVLLSYKFDYKIRLNDAFYSAYTDFDALPRDLADRWVAPGDEAITDVPVILERNLATANFDYVLAYQFYNKSTARVADGTYVRLRSASLSYNFPTQLISKMKLGSASISLEGQNLLLLYRDSKLNGQDPEFFSSGGVALPQPRMVILALNIGF